MAAPLAGGSNDLLDAARETADYPALLLGVNLGGLGTLIASMASLISYKLYAAADGARTGKYMLFFTAVNVVLLAVLWGAMVIIYK